MLKGSGCKRPVLANSTTSLNSGKEPTYDPWIVKARCAKVTVGILISPPNSPTLINLPPFRKDCSATSAVCVAPTKSIAPHKPPVTFFNCSIASFLWGLISMVAPASWASAHFFSSISAKIILSWPRAFKIEIAIKPRPPPPKITI